MRRIASIQLRGDKAEFIRNWNAQSLEKIVTGLIQLDYDSPVYRDFRSAFANYARDRSATLSERILVTYSQLELLQFELLELRFSRFAGPGGNHYGPVYRVRKVCSRCGRLDEEQISDLLVNEEDFLDEDLPDGDRLADLHVTRNGELLVSSRLRQALLHIPGEILSFRPVRFLADKKDEGDLYWQVSTRSRLGPAVGASPVERSDTCPECLLPTHVLYTKMPGVQESEFYFQRRNVVGSLLLETEDRFGRGPRYTPAHFVDAQLYRILIENGFDGFTVQPAHLVD